MSTYDLAVHPPNGETPESKESKGSDLEQLHVGPAAGLENDDRPSEEQLENLRK